jgi:predicted Fe-Mo cluster-binding NifX family protein
MRICIPTETPRGLQAKLAKHFGTAPFFTLVDLDSGAVSVRANPSCHSQPGSCHHLSLLRSEHVQALVSGGLGREAFHALRQAGIDVLVPAGDQVAEVVAALRKGESTPMTFAATCGGTAGHGCGHGHGHGHGRGQGHQHRHRHGAAPESHP